MGATQSLLDSSFVIISFESNETALDVSLWDRPTPIFKKNKEIIAQHRLKSEEPLLGAFGIFITFYSIEKMNMLISFHEDRYILAIINDKIKPQKLH